MSHDYFEYCLPSIISSLFSLTKRAIIMIGSRSRSSALCVWTILPNWSRRLITNRKSSCCLFEIWLFNVNWKKDDPSVGLIATVSSLPWLNLVPEQFVSITRPATIGQRSLLSLFLFFRWSQFLASCNVGHVPITHCPSLSKWTLMEKSIFCVEGRSSWSVLLIVISRSI